VGLFTACEQVPEHKREGNTGWIATSKRLAALFDLSSEWWMQVTVNDRRAPPVPPEYCASQAWPKVRAVREALLDTIKARQ
jgi:hypothetical protein